MISWFRNDQRLADNAALSAAIAAHDEVLPVLIIDPLQHGASPFGFERSAGFRRRFMHEGISDLAAQLRSKGSALQVHVGEPGSVLRQLAAEWKADAVHAQRLLRLGRRAASNAPLPWTLDLRLHAPNTLLLPEDLPFAIEQLPQVFTAFRTKVEKQWVVRDPIPAPDAVPSPSSWVERSLALEELPFSSAAADARGALGFNGGRAAGLARLRALPLGYTRAFQLQAHAQWPAGCRLQQQVQPVAGFRGAFTARESTPK